MLSSKIFNEPDTLFFVKRRSLYASAAGATFAFMFQALTDLVSISFILVLGIVPFFISEMLFKGRFTNENLEILKRGILDRFGILPTKMTGTNLKGAKTRKEGPDAYYDMMGRKTIGFEVTSHSSSDERGYYQGALKKLLARASSRVTVKAVLVSEELHNKFIDEHRRVLKEIGLTKQRYFVFIVLPPRSERAERNIIAAAEGLRRLTLKEIEAYKGKVVAWRGEESKKKDHLSISLKREGRYLKPYPSEFSYSSISLCALPSLITERYSRFLSPIYSKESVIVTTFTRNTWLEEVASRMKKAKAIDAKGGGTKLEDEMMETIEESAMTGDATSFTMSQVAMVYGNPEDLDETFLKVQNCEIDEDENEQEKPLYLPDEAYVAETLSLLLPNRIEHTSQRMHTVNSLTECSYYAPTPSPSTDDKGVVVFRNEHGGAHWIDHIKGGSGVLTVFQGDSGSGKSTKIGHIVRCHMLLKQLYNIPSGFTVMDMGGSHTWVDQYYKDSTLRFDLSERDEEGEFRPLPINPVSAFIGESDSATNKALLRDFIKVAMTCQEESQKVDKFVLDAIEEIAPDKNRHTIASILASIRDTLKRRIQEGIITSEDEISSWEDYLLALSKIAKGGLYGHVFDPDPETVRHQSLSGLSNFYSNLDIGDLDIKDLVTPFVELSLRMCFLISYRHKAGSGKEQSTFFVIEEFNEYTNVMRDKNLIFKLKDQARKYGFVPAVAIQSMKYLFVDGVSEEKKKAVLNGLGNVFGYSADDKEDFEIYATILKTSYDPKDLNPSLKTIKRVSQDVIFQKQKKDQKARVYPFFHISQDKVVTKCFMDEDHHALWTGTTHPGGRQIREAVMSEFNIKTPGEAGKLLGRIDFWPIPSQIQSEDTIRDIIQKVKEVI